MALQRRQLIQAAAAASLGAAALPVFAQARTKVKVGYLHTPAVDGHIFVG
ncbi:MAG: ABC transporter substrate-binding protein, partial [Comamonadaceae bacterium]